VLMYAHMLLEQCQPGSTLFDDLKTITDQADRCKRIVAGLLHFARQNKVNLQPADLNRVISKSLQSAQPPSGVGLKRIDELTDSIVELDGDQIVQVMVNLLNNAYAAMPQGGTLSIRTSQSPQHVELQVSDTGTGIAVENRKRIFDPFFTTKEAGKGTGLGLAVTYGIIKMHNGDIRVESNADPQSGPTGTTFIVVLPRNKTENKDGRNG
jgi:signal transduction histidine kinase